MVLPVHRRDEIIFLSQHSIGSKRSHAAVAKVVKCDVTTVKYWLKLVETVKRFKWFNSIWSTTGNYYQTEWTNCFSRRTTDMRYSSRHGKQSWRRQELQSTRERYNSAWTKQESNTIDLYQSHCLSKCIKKLSKMGSRKQSYELGTGDLFRRDNHSSKFSKRIDMELDRKKRRSYEPSSIRPRWTKVWGCFSSQGFGRIVYFKQNLNPELMCDIYKYDLMPTARKQFGLDSTIWELQEDNDLTHTSERALNWKTSHRIQKLDWPSMSLDLTPIENVWQLLKMKLRKK